MLFWNIPLRCFQTLSLNLPWDDLGRLNVWLLKNIIVCSLTLQGLFRIWKRKLLHECYIILRASKSYLWYSQGLFLVYICVYLSKNYSNTYVLDIGLCRFWIISNLPPRKAPNRTRRISSPSGLHLHRILKMSGIESNSEFSKKSRYLPLNQLEQNLIINILFSIIHPPPLLCSLDKAKKVVKEKKKQVSTSFVKGKAEEGSLVCTSLLIFTFVLMQFSWKIAIFYVIFFIATTFNVWKCYCFAESSTTQSEKEQKLKYCRKHRRVNYFYKWKYKWNEINKTLFFFLKRIKTFSMTYDTIISILLLSLKNVYETVTELIVKQYILLLYLIKTATRIHWVSSLKFNTWIDIKSCSWWTTLQLAFGWSEKIPSLWRRFGGLWRVNLRSLMTICLQSLV